MEKAKIFVSHSCKDAEINDDVPLEAEQDLRLRRLKYVKILRDELVRLLDRDHKVLLDRALLDPGDRWPIELLRWLGDCDAAVLLLSEDAIQSHWVLQEATILTWRRRLREDFTLIPVMLGGLSFAALDAAGFGPLQINEIQAASVLGKSRLTRAEALSLARQIAGRFAHLKSAETPNDMQRWLRRVEVHLSKIEDSPSFDDLRATLNISQDDWDHFPDRAKTVAHYLLHADLGQVRLALQVIKDALVSESKAAFVALSQLLIPTWVEASAAAALADLTTEAERRCYAINTDSSALVEDYAQRAWCSPVWWGTRFIVFNEHMGEGQEAEAVALLWESLATHFGLTPDKHTVLRKVLEAHPFFVAVGDELAASQSLLHGFLQAVADDPRLRPLTCVQLAGEGFRRALPETDELLFRIKPELTQEQIDDAEAEKILINGLLQT